MKRVLIAAIMVIAASLTFAPAYAADAGLETNYGRAWLVAKGAGPNGENLVKNLGNPTGGLNIEVPFDDVRDTNGVVLQRATQGATFGVSFLSDENFLLSFVSACYWHGVFKRQDGSYRITPYIGAQGVFIDAPEDGESAFVSGDEVTLDAGVTAGVRFDMNGLPFEIGGSYTTDVLGNFDNDIGEIHAGIVLGS